LICNYNILQYMNHVNHVLEVIEVLYVVVSNVGEWYRCQIPRWMCLFCLYVNVGYVNYSGC
jgi:hypothetical protein